MHSDKFNKVETQLQSMYHEACSSYNDGWVASIYKKELVFLQHYIKRLIKRCPDFGVLENEWEKEIMFDILKEKQ